MELKIKNCNECPFMVKQTDYDSRGDDTYIYCNYLEIKGLDNHLTSYDEIDMEPQDEDEIMNIIPLPDCPLRKDDMEIKLIL